MRSFLTGHRGFLGSPLARALRARGDEVFTTDEDLRFQCTIPKNIDRVYHLAAHIGNGAFLKAPENQWQILESNLSIDLNVISEARGACEKFFYASSYWSWDGAYTTVKDLIANQVLPLSGLSFSVGILGPVYGPGMPIGGPKERVIAAICRRLALGEPPLSGVGNDVFIRPVYVDDAVRGILNLVERGEKLSQISGTHEILIERLPGVLAGHVEPLRVKGGVPEEQISLREGLQKTYQDIKERLNESR